ncbi:hypothetical protein NDU88_005973 [Pleurodeles waltl]|uniref:Uncharacterized protein n=1 Tax=Pleurodeles waltl TaxID=8319 RepID=A0AAV7RNT3_PLEWA|nr:hypothetical protein NDU88_005973 [Pleurodeles waltl]
MHDPQAAAIFRGGRGAAQCWVRRRSSTAIQGGDRKQALTNSVGSGLRAPLRLVQSISLRHLQPALSRSGSETEPARGTG